jgi:hypothetical protein
MNLLALFWLSTSSSGLAIAAAVLLFQLQPAH